MSTNFFILFPLLLTLHLHAISATVLHLSSAVPPNSPAVTVFIKAGSVRYAPISLAPGQETTISAIGNDEYFVNAVTDRKFAGFTAYDPARDHGKADVYWRATNEGFEMSNDNAAWKLEAPWETE